MTGGRIDGIADPVEFPASKGLMGIRTGAASAMVTVTISESGERQISCAPLPQALERLKSVNNANPATGKGAVR